MMRHPERSHRRAMRTGPGSKIDDPSPRMEEDSYRTQRERVLRRVPAAGPIRAGLTSQANRASPAGGCPTSLVRPCKNLVIVPAKAVKRSAFALCVRPEGRGSEDNPYSRAHWTRLGQPSAGPDQWPRPGWSSREPPCRSGRRSWRQSP